MPKFNDKGNKYFKPAGDLSIVAKPLEIGDNLEKIKKYVKENTSGIRYGFEETNGGGKIIISFSRFVEMVEEGYNIISSEVLNEELISIEFQIIKKINDRRKKI